MGKGKSSISIFFLSPMLPSPVIGLNLERISALRIRFKAINLATFSDTTKAAALRTDAASPLVFVSFAIIDMED